MSEKRPASEETVQAFIHAVYPESTELCMAMNGEEDVLREATRLILDRRAPDPEKQELVGDMRQGLMSIRAKARFELDHPTGLHQTCLSLIAKEADALLRRYEEKRP